MTCTSGRLKGKQPGQSVPWWWREAEYRERVVIVFGKLVMKIVLKGPGVVRKGQYSNW